MKTAPISAMSFAFKLSGLALVFTLFAGCASKQPAPVSDVRPSLGSMPTVPPASTGNSNTPGTKPGETTAAVPVSSTTQLNDPTKDPTKFHTVQKGDTLYSIAFQHSLDRRELAAWNNIENPNVIRLGDHLRLTPLDANSNANTLPTAVKPGEPVTAPLILTPTVGPSSALEARLQNSAQNNAQNSAQLKVEPKAGRVPYTDAAYARLSSESAAPSTPPTSSTLAATTPAVATPANTTAAAAVVAAATAATTATNNENIDWAWPVKGKIAATFTDITKGIDVPGTRGTSILAAAPGKVIYNKSGLRGYGRLIIIRHSETWLSAYAHSEKILVAEDEVVKKGQKIAEMGSSDTDTVKLHFEIRKNGKPVDPLKFLPPQ